MRTEIKNRKENTKLNYLLSLLPGDINAYICKYISDNPGKQIDEIRMHCGAPLCLISDFSNIKTDKIITKKHIEECVTSFCKGAIYACFNTIKEGYISIGQGIRVGICGRATVQNGQITGITDFSSLNIRMPKRIYYAGDYLFEVLEKENFSSSVLIYSPPAVGKTTILRELAYKLSNLVNPIRFSVIDTRDELVSGIEDSISADTYISYPKGEAITLATRTMTPQLIICDEISTKEEADAVLYSVGCGVTIIATTHASSIEELKSKEILFRHLQKSIFKYALGVKRSCNSNKYEYTLSSLDEKCI
ncbi:MAG: hypothetical protein IJW19_07590 [Clostridia bacterium]|nr:hypothetical protein [Clostridia bacterium]